MLLFDRFAADPKDGFRSLRASFFSGRYGLFFFDALSFFLDSLFLVANFRPVECLGCTVFRREVAVVEQRRGIGRGRALWPGVVGIRFGFFATNSHDDSFLTIASVA